MTRTGCTVQVQFVLTEMMIYLAMVVDLPAWALKAIDKIKKGFFGMEEKRLKEGTVMVAWGKVCRTVEFGGLGIFSLKELGWVLRMRWLWLAKTDPMRPWSYVPL